MNRPWPALAACCALVLAAELAGPEGHEPQAAARGNEPQAQEQPVPRPDPAPPVAAILARPLFSPTRRPPDATAPLAQVAEPPRLNGLLLWSGGRRAIFTATQNTTVALQEGSLVDQWRVERITDRAVVLSHGDTWLTLQPLPAAPASGEPPAQLPPARTRDGAGHRPVPDSFLSRKVRLPGGPRPG